MKHFLSILVLQCSALVVFSQPSDNAEVMILGTAHLTQIPGFNPTMLESVLSALDERDFDVVCIEAMSGELLSDLASRNDSNFDAVLESFGGASLKRAEEIQAKFGINRLSAEARIRDLLEEDEFTEIQRAELVFLFLAITETPSAVLNFRYLEDPAMLLGMGMTQEEVDELEARADFFNEAYSLGVELAFREGLSRLYPVDDLQDEALLFTYYPYFIDDYIKNQDAMAGVKDHPIFKEDDAAKQKALEEKDLLSYYEFLNGKRYADQDFEAQWKIWFDSDFESGSDLGRYYLWEMRNLDIAARVMRVVAQHPGERILVIYGASHRSFLERHLAEMPGVEVIHGP